MYITIIYIVNIVDARGICMGQHFLKPFLYSMALDKLLLNPGHGMNRMNVENTDKS